MDPVQRAKRIVSDHQFLAGPRVRRKELRTVVNVSAEFLRGFRKLHFAGPCVTVFGSARTAETEPAYIAARDVSERLGRFGFSIMTGGGPGIMEAANRGAREAGAHSIGCTIELPAEQRSNPYLDLEIPFEHFFVRKVMLVKYSYGFVVMKGGFGTGDEMFEALTLIQTGKIADFPVVLMGTDFWSDLLAQIDTMVEAGTIAPGDTDLLCVTDDPEVAANHIHDVAVQRFDLGDRLRPLRVLGESRPN